MSWSSDIFNTSMHRRKSLLFLKLLSFFKRKDVLSINDFNQENNCNNRNTGNDKLS